MRFRYLLIQCPEIITYNVRMPYKEYMTNTNSKASFACEMYPMFAIADETETPGIFRTGIK